MNDQEMQKEVFRVLALGVRYGKLRQREAERSRYPLLPIACWTERFCLALNQIPYENAWFRLSEEDRVPGEPDRKKLFQNLPEEFRPKVWVREDLPVPYVRIHGTVLLSAIATKEDRQQCMDSVQNGLTCWQNADHWRTGLKESDRKPRGYEDKELRKILELCALDSIFTNSTRPQMGSDHNICSELLQNVNDHIDPDGTLDMILEQGNLIISYPEENGFLVRDFFAVCTIGNSGNKRNEKGADAIGCKGTGFKSLYNWFSKVVIESNGVRCTLDDEIHLNYVRCITEEGRFDLRKLPKCEVQKEPTTYPVPRFEGSCLTFGQNRLRLTLRREKQASVEELLETLLLNSKNYYFLANIGRVTWNGKTVITRKAVHDAFWYYEVSLPVDEELLEQHPRWRDREPEYFWQSARGKLQVLFPKKPEPGQKGLLYCGLPTRQLLPLPIYVNCPAFELTDDRSRIFEEDDENDWNGGIGALAFIRDDCCLRELYTLFAKQHPKEAFDSLLAVSPQIEGPFYMNADTWESWRCTTPVIPVVQKKISRWAHLCLSIRDFADTIRSQPVDWKKAPILLPTYLYDAFSLWGGIDDFSISLPFAYAKWLDQGRLKQIYDWVCNYLDREMLSREYELFSSPYDAYQKILWETPKLWDALNTSIWIYLIGKLSNFDGDLPEGEQILLQKIYKDKKGFPYGKRNWFCVFFYLGKDRFYAHYQSFLEDEAIRTAEGTYLPVASVCEEVCDFYDDLYLDDTVSDILPGLRDRLYSKSEDGGPAVPVEPQDPFLQTVLHRYFENPGALYDLVEEELEEFSEEELEELFWEGCIPVQYWFEGNPYHYRFSGEDLYYSASGIPLDGSLVGTNWGELAMDLDEKVIRADFYGMVDLTLLKKAVSAYFSCYTWPEKIQQAITVYLSKPEEHAALEKICFLFGVLLTAGATEPIRWNPQLNPVLRLEAYTEKLTDWLNDTLQGNTEEISVPIFAFTDQLSQLPYAQRERIRDQTSTQEQQQLRRFFLRYREGNGGVCLTKNEEGNVSVVVFGLKGLKNLLKLLDIQIQLDPQTCWKLHSEPPVLECDQPYDSWSDHAQVLSREKWPLPENLDQNSWQYLLTQRWEWGDLCFPGYGDARYGRNCPICGGLLLAESSALRVRFAELYREKGQLFTLPLLLCINCSKALLDFCDRVSVCDESGRPYKNKATLQTLLCSEEPVRVCFDRHGRTPVVREVALTPLQRYLALRQLESIPDA